MRPQIMAACYGEGGRRLEHSVAGLKELRIISGTHRVPAVAGTEIGLSP